MVLHRTESQMGIRRLFRRRKKQGKIDVDELADITSDIFEGADKQEIRDFEMFALRVELGIGPEDPRSYEELVAELERRGG